MTACTIRPGTTCQPGHLVCVLAEAGMLGEQADREPAMCGAVWTSERNGKDTCLLEPDHERWSHRGRFAEWRPE